jgi:hypothetical protein
MGVPAFAVSRRARWLTAVLAAAAPLVFLLSEAISALAWTAGTYDYRVNFISDLGTTVCGSTFGGRVMCSPLHGVMNFGFVAMGVGVAVTASLLATRLPTRRRVTVTVIGSLIAVGMVLVAVFHGGVESVANNTIVLHALGAGLAIALGNILAILVGASAGRLRFPRWYALTGMSLGVVGLVALVLLLTGTPVVEPAVYERISVYTIFAWLLTTAVVQAASNRRER